MYSQEELENAGPSTLPSSHKMTCPSKIHLKRVSTKSR